jgi:hypothetical protein
MPLEGDWQRAGLARSVTLPLEGSATALFASTNSCAILRGKAQASVEV